MTDLLFEECGILIWHGPPTTCDKYPDGHKTLKKCQTWFGLHTSHTISTHECPSPQVLEHAFGNPDAIGGGDDAMDGTPANQVDTDTDNSLFSNTDADGDGFITYDELEEAVVESGASASDAAEFMNAIDADNDNRISLEEHSAWMRGIWD